MTIPDTKDAVAVLREALESLRSTSLVYAELPIDGSYYRYSRPAGNLRDACVKNLPALLDELEQLRSIVDAHDNLYVGECISVGCGWFAAHNSDRYFILRNDALLNDLTFPTVWDTLAWLRSDAGKAAVERAKGGQP